MKLLCLRNATRKIIRQGHEPYGWTALFVPTCFFLLITGCTSTRPNPTVPIPGRQVEIAPMLAAQVDLDYVYDPDIRQQKKNLRFLRQRVCSLGLTTVLLQAFADPDGNDAAEALYFPNHALPMRRNLFPQVAQTLRRCGLKVYAWMPMLAFTLGPGHENLLVHKIDKSGKIVPTDNHRLSPFNPAGRKIILQIYEDLARSATFDGILFHDDAVLSDYEDASPAALAAYKKAGFSADITRIRGNDALMEKWSRLKTKALIRFSRSLLVTVRRYHPAIRSGRALYARAILQPESEQWFAQSLPLFLQAYDYTFVLAMPFMEKAKHNNSWLTTLADRATAWTVNTPSLVFELQTVDWRRRKKIAPAETVAQMKLLKLQGIVSFAYYPDDFLRNHPDANSMRRVFAELNTHGRAQQP